MSNWEMGWHELSSASRLLSVERGRDEQQGGVMIMSNRGGGKVMSNRGGGLVMSNREVGWS